MNTDKNNSEKLEHARCILQLPLKVSIISIKKAYYELSKKFHPDSNLNKIKDKKYNQKILQITEAYKYLIKYCENFSINLKKDKEKDDKYDHERRFYSDFIK